MTVSPDPLLSANIYGRPDDVLTRVILPFWRELGRGDRVDLLLWPVRYACGGEHLKIRIHAATALREEISERLSEIVDSIDLAPQGEPVSIPTARPMDPEDALLERDNRSPLIWTRYQRSPLVLGGDPLLQEDGYVARLIACLGQAWNVALSQFDLDKNSHIPYSRRVTVLFRLVASGLRTALASPDQRKEYLLYHRDWIVRFHSLRSGKGREQSDTLLNVFDRKLSQAGAVGQEILGTLTEADPALSGTFLDRWENTVFQLASYLRCAKIDGVIDPFAPDPIFPVLFRLFHSLANGLGITALNEGVAHHLVLASLGDPPPRALALLPPKLEARIPAEAWENPAEVSVFDFESEYLWTHYVATASPEGSRWAEDYRAVGRQVGSNIDQALGLLRRKCFDSGQSLLEQIDARRHALIHEYPSVGHVLSRFYYGALSYQHYATGDFQEAFRALEQAAESIRSAIEISSFLLPLAPIASDIPLKQAALARRAQRWEEMQEYLIEFLEMGLDQRPLCTLHNGRAVHYRDLRDFLLAIPLSEQQRNVLRNLTDDRLRLVGIRRSIERLYALPGFLIPYP